MKKINKLQIIKTIALSSMFLGLSLTLTSCDDVLKLLNAEEMEKFFKLWLNKDTTGINKLLTKLKQNDKEKYNKIKGWLEKQEYFEQSDYNWKQEAQNDRSSNYLQLKSFKSNLDTIIDDDKSNEKKNIKQDNRTQNQQVNLSNIEIKNQDININFLNRLMYTDNEANYNEDKYSFQNRKYHNFDGLEYNLKTYPYLLKTDFIDWNLLNSAPIYHMLYNSFSPISFLNRCQNGLINKTWKQIQDYDVEGETNKDKPDFKKMKTLKAHIGLWTKYFGNELIVKAIIEGVTAQELIDNGYFENQKDVNDWYNDLKNQIKLENEIQNSLRNNQTLTTALKGYDHNDKKIEINIGNYTFKIIKPKKDNKKQFATLAYVKVNNDWKKLINQITIEYTLNNNGSSYETKNIKISYSTKFITNRFFSTQNPFVKFKNNDNVNIESINTKNLNLFFHTLPLFKGFAKKDIETTGNRIGRTVTKTFETKTKSLWYWQNIPTRDGYYTGGKKGLIDVTLTPEMIMEPNFLFKEKDILWLYKNFNLTEFAKDNRNYKLKNENKTLFDYFSTNFSCLDSKLHSYETFIFLFKIAKWRLDILNSYVSTIIDLEKDYSWVKAINELENKENLHSWFNYKVKTTTSIFEHEYADDNYIIKNTGGETIRQFKKTRFKQKENKSQ